MPFPIGFFRPGMSVPEIVVRQARTSNITIGPQDSATFIDITSGTFTQTISACSELGIGWYIWLRNSGTGDITITTNGVDQWDTLTSFVMYGQETRLVQCDGTKITSIVLHPFYRKATTSFAFVMPPGYVATYIDLVGAGGGGGAGRRGAASTLRAGGASGGAPSRVAKEVRNIAAGTSVTVTIGAGGSGGVAQTVDSTDGADGVSGGNTIFVSYLTAYGGIGGKGGGANNVGTSGSGSAGVGGTKNNGQSNSGGNPASTYFGSSATGAVNNTSTGGAGYLVASTESGNSEWGGAAGSSCDLTGTVSTNSAGSSLFGVSGASQGGWITSANTLPTTAPTAGLNGTYAHGGGVTGGTCGASPTVGSTGPDASSDDACGNPGAGGGSTITALTAAAAGGPGGYPGGPGGGGGAVLNGSNSGAGGAGANGRAIIRGIV